MLEILNINAVHKNTLLATCDVRIVPWKMTLCEVKIFEKGDSRWIKLPSREWVNPQGEIKYIDLVVWDTDGIKKRFEHQVMAAVDKYLESNPEMKPEDVVKEDDVVPF